MEKIKLLGLQFASGQDHPGVARACHYLRDVGFKSRLKKSAPVKDLGDLVYELDLDTYIQDGIKNLKEVSSANEQISRFIQKQSLHNSFLLNFGGDHGVGLGTVHGMLAQNPETVVVWADAHGDINTPEVSPSGNFHGMPLAFLIGIAKHPEFSWIREKLLPEKLILIGQRDLDQGEIDIINRYQIQYFSSEELNRIGASEVMEMALEKADPMGLAPIHLSFDVDLFDKYDVCATGTRVADGPLIKEVFSMGKILGETGRLRSMDLVEFNPDLGSEFEVRKSASLIMQFVESTIESVFEAQEVSRFSKKDFLLRALGKSFF